jgi:hypothetical protein
VPSTHQRPIRVTQSALLLDRPSAVNEPDLPKMLYTTEKSLEAKLSGQPNTANGAAMYPRRLASHVARSASAKVRRQASPSDNSLQNQATTEPHAYAAGDSANCDEYRVGDTGMLVTKQHNGTRYVDQSG